jgi:outer membrane protein assembly factor BamB
VSAPPAFAANDIVVPFAGPEWTGLTCFELAAAGQPQARWTCPLELQIEVSPVISGTTIICLEGQLGSAGRMVAIDRRSGVVAWSRQIERVSPTLSADRDSVYFADVDGSLIRMDLAGGKLWQTKIGLAADASDVRGEIVVAATSTLPQLTALDRISGEVLWKSDLENTPCGSPAIVGTRVFVPTSQAMEIRSIVDGSRITTVENLGTRAPAFVDGNRVVGVTVQGELVIGSALGGVGTRRASGADSRWPPLVGADAIVFVDADGRLIRVLAAGSGQPEPWYEPGTGQKIVSPPVLRSGRVYAAVSGAGLVCLQSGNE